MREAGRRQAPVRCRAQQRPPQCRAGARRRAPGRPRGDPDQRRGRLEPVPLDLELPDQQLPGLGEPGELDRHGRVHLAGPRLPERHGRGEVLGPGGSVGVLVVEPPGRHQQEGPERLGRPEHPAQRRVGDVEGLHDQASASVLRRDEPSEKRDGTVVTGDQGVEGGVVAEARPGDQGALGGADVLRMCHGSPSSVIHEPPESGSLLTGHTDNARAGRELRVRPADPTSSERCGVLSPATPARRRCRPSPGPARARTRPSCRRCCARRSRPMPARRRGSARGRTRSPGSSSSGRRTAPRPPRSWTSTRTYSRSACTVTDDVVPEWITALVTSSETQSSALSTMSSSTDHSRSTLETNWRACRAAVGSPGSSIVARVWSGRRGHRQDRDVVLGVLGLASGR